MRIFLIGFMGSGKSYVGSRLADLLGYTFIDLDDKIEENTQKNIGQIFEEEGEDYFRALERDTLQTLNKHNNTVIACGGGTPCFHNNMEWMKNHGKTIYLDLPPTVLVKRLNKEKEHRPLIKDLSDKGELLHFIEQKLSKRAVFYQKADFIFNGNNETIEAWVALQHLIMYH